MTTIIKETNGESVLQIPKSILESLCLNEHSVVSLEIKDGALIITKKIEWTVEELQSADNFDLVMEDVVHNKQVHHITHDGKRYVLAPYSEELIK